MTISSCKRPRMDHAYFTTYHVLYCCSAQVHEILEWLQHAKEFCEGKWSIRVSERDTEDTIILG